MKKMIFLLPLTFSDRKKINKSSAMWKLFRARSLGVLIFKNQFSSNISCDTDCYYYDNVDQNKHQCI